MAPAEKTGVRRVQRPSQKGRPREALESVASTPPAASATHASPTLLDASPAQKIAARPEAYSTPKIADVFADLNIFADLLPPKKLTAEAFADAICQLVDAYRGNVSASPAMSVPTPPVGPGPSPGAAAQPAKTLAKDNTSVARDCDDEADKELSLVSSLSDSTAKPNTGSVCCSSMSPAATTPTGSASIGNQLMANRSTTPRPIASSGKSAVVPPVIVSFSGSQNPIGRPEFSRAESMSPRAATSQLCGQLTGRLGISAEKSGCSRSASPRGRSLFHAQALSGAVSSMPATRVVSPPHRRTEASPARSAFTQRLLASYPNVGPVECGTAQHHESASSKSATRCYSYSCDPSDPVDRLVMETIVSLGCEAAARLRIRRLEPGKYEVDGRRISLRWNSSASELVACEDAVGGDAAGRGTHLVSYLRQAADVAASLGGRQPGAPIIARVPQDMRLTFSSAGPGTDSIDSEQLHRKESMRIACEEALLRERAAEAYENGLSRRPVMGGAPPPPAGLATLTTAASTQCQPSTSPSPRTRYQASVAPSTATAAAASPCGRYQAPVTTSASSVSPSPRRRCQSSFGSPSVPLVSTTTSFAGSSTGSCSNLGAVQLANASPPC